MSKKTRETLKKSSFLKSLLIVWQTGFFVSFSAAEEINQEFKSKADFNAFWDISTWSNNEQQYSASNVFLDTANGWVRLKINASPQGTKPVNGEISSKRSNFLYGSYRASIKFDNIPGGVVGWFVYRTTTDLHEIDVEYLTRDINNIHFTLHHVQTDVDYKKVPVSFDPTTEFHEYRFDWSANKVVYYIDGNKVDSLLNKVPDAACSIMLNFWSANIPDWGGQAPAKDAYMYVDYMRHYSTIPTAIGKPGIPPSSVSAPAIANRNENSVFIQFENAKTGPAAPSIFNALGRLLHKSAPAKNASTTRRIICIRPK
jgi:beta-glucanase (GH16 family)